MLLFPVSTDVHDGKIRLAAIEILTVCVLVHLLVLADTSWINNKIQELIGNYNKMHEEYLLSQKPASLEEAMKLVENPPPFLQEEEQKLDVTIGSLKQSALLYKLAFTPAKFTWTALVTALFVHGGWLHLIGNLIFFYVCGVAMEKYWGFWRFIILYLFCGVGANLFYMASTMAIPEAANVPLVGASGAVAGAMGAFVATHPQVKVKIFYLFFWKRGTFRIPAYLYFGFWFFSDLIQAIVNAGETSGVAYTAHVGGFMLGALMGKLVKSESVVSRIRQHSTDQPVPEMRMNTQILSAMYSDSESVPATFQKHIPLSVLAWQEFHEGNYTEATDQLTHAINNYFQSPKVHRPQIKENISHILKFSDHLSFPPPQMYQWAKNLVGMELNTLAIACFDNAAQADNNPHIQKTSLLNAAMQRIRAKTDPQKARDDLKRVIEMDPESIHAQQAEQFLKYLSGDLKTAEEIEQEDKQNS